MGTDVAERQKHQRGKTDHGHQHPDFFLFPPDRAERVGEGTKGGTGQNGGPGGEKEVFHESRLWRVGIKFER